MGAFRDSRTGKTRIGFWHVFSMFAAPLVLLILTPALISFVDWSVAHNLQANLNYWQGLGYVVYADPSGNFLPTAGDNVSDLGSEAASFNDAWIDGEANITTLKAPTGRGAAYVIAASDASALEKAQADEGYVCDGTDDDVTINAAWTAMTAGGILQLSSGHFNIGTTQIILDGSNKTIRGTGLGTTLKLQNNSDSTRTILVSGDNITIKSLRVDGNSANQDAWSGGISIEGSASYVWMSDVEITNGYTFNLNMTDDPHHINLTHIYSHNGVNGVEINNGAYDIEIAQSLFENNSNSGATFISGAANELYNINFHDNKIYNITAGRGISVSGTAPKYWITINGNQIIDANHNGIHFNAVTKSIISNNAVVWTSGDNKTGSGEGIDVYASNQTSVIGNYSAGHKHATHGTGVSFDSGANGNLAIGNVLENNSHDGLRIWASADNLITGNVFRNNGENGVLIDDSDGSAINNTIEGNQAYDDQGSATQDYGIQEAASADYNVITDNKLRGNVTAGILTTGTNTRVSRNYGYVTENSGTVTINTGSTTAVVTHGLAITPSLQNISITPQGTLGDAAFWWLSSANATSFIINLNADPTTANVTFGWNHRN